MNASIRVSVFTLLLTSSFCSVVKLKADPDIITIQEEDEDTVRHPTIVHDTTQQKGPDFSADPDERNTDYWRTSAANLIAEKESWKQQYGTARNIILFMGDGMSIPTLMAARVEKGRRENQRGPEKSQLSFEKFPHVGLSKTYCVNSQVADSACSATAYLTGVKTNIHTIGLNGNVVLGSCSSQNVKSNHVESIVAWAQQNGRATGVVTTTRVTHASPAGTYAHIAHREWEWDELITDHSEPCDDIAKQLVRSSPGKDINVVLGGGWNGFLPPSGTTWGRTGRRKDNSDLLKVWMDHKTNLNKTASVVFTRSSLLSIDAMKTDYLMGLFNKDHLLYSLDNKKRTDPEPSLAEMTEVAINILKKNPKGFFLFVEGGEIDFGHHDTKPHHAIEETLEFSKAIERALELTSINDTLVVVTADHAHTMSVSGYPMRGNDIFKLAGTSNVDKKPISTLSYANGPAYKRLNLSQENLDDPNYQYPVTSPLKSETHGGDDVGIYARGPWSHLFTGVLEQNFIPMAMARAGQIGQFENSTADPNASSLAAASPLLIVCLIMVLRYLL